MCREPNIDHNGNTIWCRKCDICRFNRSNDWVGRALAEARYADNTHSVTLTYGRDENNNPDHIHAAVLFYSDVQKMFKRLRKDGYKFKYLVAGEYGSEKRRAHWHVLLFWQGSNPSITLDENCQFEYWPHGHTHWQNVSKDSAAAVKYVTKYIQKDNENDASEAAFRMSKKPPLGHEWFQQYAKLHVDEGLAPQSLHYEFNSIKLKTGKRQKFYMQGVTADNYLKAYANEYIARFGHFRYPESAMVADWLDGQYAKYYEIENWVKEKQNGKITEHYKETVLREQCEKHGGVKYIFPPTHNADAVAIANDGALFEYGNPERDPVKILLDIVNERKPNEFIRSTVTSGEE